MNTYDSIDYACSCWCIRRYTLTVISSSMFITRLCIVVSGIFAHWNELWVNSPCSWRIIETHQPSICTGVWPTFTGCLCISFFFVLLAQWSSSVFSQVETRDFQAISRTIKRIFKESHPLQLDWWKKRTKETDQSLLSHNCLFRNAGGVYINVRTYTLAGLNFLDPIWLKLRFGSLASSHIAYRPV